MNKRFLVVGSLVVGFVVSCYGQSDYGMVGKNFFDTSIGALKNAFDQENFSASQDILKKLQMFFEKKPQEALQYFNIKVLVDNIHDIDTVGFVLKLIGKLYQSNSIRIDLNNIYYKSYIGHDGIILLWVENSKNQLIAYAYSYPKKDSFTSYYFDHLHVIAFNARQYGIGENLRNMMGFIVHDQGGNDFVGFPDSFDLRKGEDKDKMQEKLVKFYKRGVNAELVEGGNLGVNLVAILGPNPKNPQYKPGIVYTVREEHIDVKSKHDKKFDEKQRARL